MSRVLYISYDGLTDALGRSQVIPYLKGLVENGHELTVLSLEKPEGLAKSKDVVAELLRSSNITWHYHLYKKGVPVIHPLLLMRKLKGSANKLQKENNFEIVHCRSYLPGMIGLALKRKYGVKFLFDIRGFWADERIEGNIWDLNNPIFNKVYHYMKEQEVDLFKNADHVVSLTHNAKNVLNENKEFGLEKTPISVIPCCVNLEHFNPNNVNESIKEKYKSQLKISDSDVVLTYLGSIGTWYMLDEMLDFFKVLLDKNANAKFLFISNTNEEELRMKAKERNIDDAAILVQGVTYDEVPSMLSLSNYSIFFIKPVFSKKASSPIKQGELMAMGIPIICNTDIGDTDYIIDKYSCGALIKGFESSDYKDVVKNMDKLDEIESSTCRFGAEDFYSLKKGIESYNNVYNDIVS